MSRPGLPAHIRPKMDSRFFLGLFLSSPSPTGCNPFNAMLSGVASLSALLPGVSGVSPPDEGSMSNFRGVLKMLGLGCARRGLSVRRLGLSGPWTGTLEKRVVWPKAGRRLGNSGFDFDGESRTL